MKPETARAALRAAAALTGIAACAAPKAPPPPPKPDCVAITQAAFGTADPYPGDKNASTDPAVIGCCNSSLMAMSSTSAPLAANSDEYRVYGYHRWACCAVATAPYQPGSLCIPWGPPVPPSTSWRRRTAAVA